MNLRADFLRARRAAAIGRRLFALGILALLVAGFTCAQLSRQDREVEGALANVEARLHALDAEGRQAHTLRDGAARHARAAQPMRDYALSFQWNELFQALETLQGTRVLSLTVTLGAGVALVELDSPTVMAAERAAEHLKNALPEFDLALTQQHTTAGRTRTMLVARDRLAAGG